MKGISIPVWLYLPLPLDTSHRSAFISPLPLILLFCHLQAFLIFPMAVLFFSFSFYTMYSKDTSLVYILKGSKDISLVHVLTWRFFIMFFWKFQQRQVCGHGLAPLWLWGGALWQVVLLSPGPRWLSRLISTVLAQQPWVSWLNLPVPRDWSWAMRWECGVHLIHPGAAAPQYWPCSVLLWVAHLTAGTARLPFPRPPNFSINRQQLHPTLMCVAHKSFC